MIVRFERLEDAREAFWESRTDGRYFRRVSELFDLAGRLAPPEYPHGVFRHKDLESARKQRESWDLEIARRRMLRRKTENSKPTRKARA